MPKKLTIVLAGCGSISKRWVESALKDKDVAIVGLADINRDAAMKRAKEFSLSSVIIGTDITKVLKETKPDIVFDCTVPKAHVHITLEALKHGCHVLGEKPLADSMKNARKMVKTAKNSGKIYAVMQNRRYDPWIRAIEKFLYKGKIGNVTTVNCDFYVGAHFGGFRDKMEHALLLDMSIHTFDAARLISDADPVSVYCHEWNPKGSWYDHGASAVTVFEMTGGIVYTYRGSWSSEGMNTTWESSWHIIGDKGSLVWNGADSLKAQRVSGNTGLTRKIRDIRIPVSYGHSVPQGAHAGVIKDFLHCVRTGKTPETICTDNIKSLAMVFGAIESAETGKRIKIIV